MSAVSYIHLKSGTVSPRLSLPPFKAVIVIEESASGDWRDEVAEWLVRSSCLCCCTWGENCEEWHDRIDRANIRAFVGQEIPADRLVMTTWHEKEPLTEAFWFLACVAEHPVIEFEQSLIVHVAVRERRVELLEQYRLSADD